MANGTRRTGQGSCGGTPRKDGSGGGSGNRNTSNQPVKASTPVSTATPSRKK